MSENYITKMVEAARIAKEKAYVPYSNFPLGAAVLTEDNQIFTGCNIENASFGLTNCAERTAIFKAVSAGNTKFKALVLVTDQENPITPCGACRQVINEFGKDIKIVMVGKNGKQISCTSSELLPGAFKQEDMHNDI